LRNSRRASQWWKHRDQYRSEAEGFRADAAASTYSNGRFQQACTGEEELLTDDDFIGFLLHRTGATWTLAPAESDPQALSKTNPGSRQQERNAYA
jgi:hypothetical protein